MVAEQEFQHQPKSHSYEDITPLNIVILAHIPTQSYCFGSIYKLLEFSLVASILLITDKMGDKETKAFLKEARELIKNKDFKAALKEVKKVLNKELMPKL